MHQICQVAAEIRKEHKYPGTYVKGRRLLVSEVFSPPRFSQIAESYGFAAWSYDLINGYDFRKSADRDRVKHELQAQPPDLLVLCPPCTALMRRLVESEQFIFDFGREDEETKGKPVVHPFLS